ncbi:MAG TPA: Nramp family divalent metal transporter [Micromonosporaceae bacterium]
MVDTVIAAQQALAGKRRGLRAVMPFLGPAFIACVAYVDPGNFATNVAAGAEFGYTLGWVVLTANLMAMLIQSLSAKLGIATGKSLPEVCRDRLPKWTVRGLWVQAELVAMATDLAEFTGAALGLHLVFGLPIWLSALLAALATFAVLAMEVGGFRRLEAAITALVGVVVLAFCLELWMSRPQPGAVAQGVFVPQLPGGAALLAVSIVGATVMPHVIYLHSALVRRRVTSESDDAKRRIFRFEIIDVVCAMGLAGLINLSMLAMAAAVFFTRGDTTAGEDIGAVVAGLNSFIGDHAGMLFGIALLVSGIASSCVGTMSGQVVMEGFLHRRIPVFIRRAVTMIPALVLLAIGFSPTRALVLSQVFLSFGIPFALIPLVIFTANKKLMGKLANRRLTNIAAGVVAGVIVGLNVYLLATG